MSDLEDRLLNALVEKHRTKGVNYQKILDNTLFKQLPLHKKVEFIERSGSVIGNNPSFNPSVIGRGVLGGAVAGAMGTMTYAAAHGGFTPDKVIPGLVIGAVSGATLGGIGGAIRAIIDRSRDAATKDAAGDGVRALIQRDSTAPVTTSHLSVTPNRFISAIEHMVDSKVGASAYQATLI